MKLDLSNSAADAASSSSSSAAAASAAPAIEAKLLQPHAPAALKPIVHPPPPPPPPASVAVPLVVAAEVQSVGPNKPPSQPFKMPDTIVKSVSASMTRFFRLLQQQSKLTATVASLKELVDTKTIATALKSKVNIQLPVEDKVFSDQIKLLYHEAGVKATELTFKARSAALTKLDRAIPSSLETDLKSVIEQHGKTTQILQQHLPAAALAVTHGHTQISDSVITQFFYSEVATTTARFVAINAQTDERKKSGKEIDRKMRDEALLHQDKSVQELVVKAVREELSNQTQSINPRQNSRGRGKKQHNNFPTGKKSNHASDSQNSGKQSGSPKPAKHKNKPDQSNDNQKRDHKRDRSQNKKSGQQQNRKQKRSKSRDNRHSNSRTPKPTGKKEQNHDQN
jgi:hypothetical protein